MRRWEAAAWRVTGASGEGGGRGELGAQPAQLPPPVGCLEEPSPPGEPHCGEGPRAPRGASSPSGRQGQYPVGIFCLKAPPNKGPHTRACRWVLMY